MFILASGYLLYTFFYVCYHTIYMVNFRLFFLFFLVTTVGTVVFVMPFRMVGMDHHEAMPMTNCPFMFDRDKLCMMSVLEHILSWQQLTTMVVNDVSSLFLVLLFGTFTILVGCLELCAKWIVPIHVFFLRYCIRLFGTSLFPRAP